MEKVRIGMVGAGNIANVHLCEYENIDSVEIVAICDINAERLKETADRFGISKRYASEAEMIADVELDAVDVCVWTCNHAKCTIDALDAGLHVFCEKPMASSVKEAEEMLEASKRNNRVLMIGVVNRFKSEVYITEDFINNGYLGDIYYSRATYLRRHGAPGGWFCNKALAGGGPVLDLGVHVVDLTWFLMGKPKPISVFASTADVLKDRKNIKTYPVWRPKDAKPDDICDVEDFGVAIIKYEGNKTTLLETSCSLNCESVSKKEMFGTKGGIKIDENGLKIYTEMNDFLVDVTPITENYKNEMPMFEAELRHFADCITTGIPCRAPAEEGLVITKILFAIYESARTGHEVLIES